MFHGPKPTELSLEQMEASVPILPSLQLKLFFGLVRTENLNCPYLLPKSIWFPGRKISKVNWKYFDELKCNFCGILLYKHTYPQNLHLFQHPQYRLIIFLDVTSWFNLNSFSLDTSKLKYPFLNFTSKERPSLLWLEGTVPMSYVMKRWWEPDILKYRLFFL